MRPLNSGWKASMPESITATLTVASLRLRRPERPGLILRQVPLLRGVGLGVVEGERRRREDGGKEKGKKRLLAGARLQRTC